LDIDTKDFLASSTPQKAWRREQTKTFLGTIGEVIIKHQTGVREIQEQMSAMTTRMESSMAKTNPIDKEVHIINDGHPAQQQQQGSRVQQMLMKKQGRLQEHTRSHNNFGTSA
jgi:uncharacterized coiled-coil protein SlyX